MPAIENLRKPPENIEQNILRVNPSELMRDNPAALIVNKESYRGMEIFFAPRRFDPPQVARISTYATDKGTVIRMFVIDGHTRTKYAFDHKDSITQHPEFIDGKIPVRDVTDALLNDHRVVHINERLQNQNTLSMLQYLRAVVPQTIEHSEIAPDRIAAHLINGWSNMIGVGLAEKFSALAALSLLENPTIPTATSGLLKKYLMNQREIVDRETPKERESIQRALIDINAVITESKLFKEQVARAAFLLVCTGSLVIGGEKESEKQIYGLLHTALVSRKLVDSIPQIGVREQRRLELGKLISEAFKKFKDHPDREQIINTLGKVVNNPDLTLDDTEEVLSSPSPSEKYDQIRNDRNILKLENYYKVTQKKDDLSQPEQTLIGNLGSKTYLNERDIPTLTNSIRNALIALKSLQSLRNQLNNRTILIDSGVQERFIDTSLASLNSNETSLLSSQTHQAVASRIRELNDEIKRVNLEILKQTLIFKIGQMIRDVYGDQVQKGFGLQIKDNIARYLLREFQNTYSEPFVKQRLEQLNNLDSDLQSRVVLGDIRIATAERIQRERKSGDILYPTITTTPIKPPQTPTVPTDIRMSPPSSSQPDVEDIKLVE